MVAVLTATVVLRMLRTRLPEAIPLIGVGGMRSANSHRLRNKS